MTVSRMSPRRKAGEAAPDLPSQLKALSNRHAIGILQVLNPATGEMVPTLGWDNIVDGLLTLDGISAPKSSESGERSQQQAEYEEKRQSLMSGGTIYETMSKLTKAGFVVSIGEKGKKQRGFMITHKGRLALAAVAQLGGPIKADTDVKRAASVLLKHKNFVSLLPAQEKFLRETQDIDENLVMQMPPGSGKTFLAMIAILLKLQEGTRCLYLSPYTSLSRQVVEEYGPLFEELGYSVVRYDGLHHATDEELENGNLLIVMYETLAEALLEKKKWTENIGLSVIDELTELDSSQPEIEADSIGTDRSTKLDAVISILKMQSQIITLSSRFGETGVVADWLEAKVFRPDVRLAPDEFIVFQEDDEFRIESRDGTQESALQRDDVLGAIMDHLGNYKDKSVLVVVGYRSRAEGVARWLARKYPRDTHTDVRNQIVGAGEELPLSGKLEQVLQYGTAFHHSGLDAGVRERLERAIGEKRIRTVAATTGITAGISFPFDCVIILLDPGMYFLATRSRYLQVAGRIGEYHLSRHGGRVYLVFERPSRHFRNPEEMEEKLLHRPLNPLYPGGIYPGLAVGLLARNTLNRRRFKRNDLKEWFLRQTRETLRGKIDDEYSESLGKYFDDTFKWLVRDKVFEKSNDSYKMAKEAKAAVSAGLDIIDYLSVRRRLDELDEAGLIDMLLDLRLPQSVRPKTIRPLVAELDLIGIEQPDDWYLRRLPDRRETKKMVLENWIDEREIGEIVEQAREETRGTSLDEGDLGSLLGICSNAASELSDYLRAIKKMALADRMHILSRQLRYGVRRDLAESNLLELRLASGDYSPSNRLPRSDARILFERGYCSIDDVVRKDIDASKKGLARERFAKNSGLDEDHALEIYKAAMKHVRAKLDSDE